jgi:hypothetical protein
MVLFAAGRDDRVVAAGQRAVDRRVEQREHVAAVGRVQRARVRGRRERMMLHRHRPPASTARSAPTAAARASSSAASPSTVNCASGQRRAASCNACTVSSGPTPRARQS